MPITHPVTGQPLSRDTRPATFSFQGRSLTVTLPGWYPKDEGDDLHENKDLLAMHRAMTLLKIAIPKR